MKKIYFAPEVNIVKIQNNSILCLSANADGDNIKYQGYSGNAGDEGLSRGFFGDDDE